MLVMVVLSRLVNVFVRIVFKLRCVIFEWWLGVKLLSVLSIIVIDEKLVNLYNVKLIMVVVFLENLLMCGLKLE